jgi:SAM-dependent methyltransferase
MTAAKEYVLGTDDAEFHRLGLQHRLWGDLAHAAWRRAGIQPGHTVLDVGSGPGFASLDLAPLVGPDGRIVAVDESAAFIDRLRAEASARGVRHLDAHVADVQRLDSLPLAPASVHAAYARWVLCFVADPAAVVRGVARLLAPGGRFAIHDYFNYESMTLAPRSPDFSKVIAAVGKSWRDRGGDPDICGRLPRLARDAGLDLVHLSVEQRIARPGDTMWNWPDSFWRSFVPRLVATGHLTPDDAKRFDDAWRRVRRDECAFMMLPAVFEIILEKPGAAR